MCNFIEAIERCKKQLDDLISSYREFREKLDTLPPEIATEAKSLLAAEGEKPFGRRRRQEKT